MKFFDASIPCHVFKTHVDSHKNVKTQILNSIEKLGIHGFSLKHEKIYNTDWHVKLDRSKEFQNKEYIDIVLPIINKHLTFIANKTGLQSPLVSELWFQQYAQEDFHGWHVHGRCMFSNIYYVELPQNSAKTTFRHFGQEFEIGVEEGDILTFPSFLQHCSKPNKDVNKKTVIAFNVDFEGCDASI